MINNDGNILPGNFPFEYNALNDFMWKASMKIGKRDFLAKIISTQAWHSQCTKAMLPTVCWWKPQIYPFCIHNIKLSLLPSNSYPILPYVPQASQPINKQINGWILKSQLLINPCGINSSETHKFYAKYRYFQLYFRPF